MIFVVKNIGFEENKPCRLCGYLAWHQVGDQYYCRIHMAKFIRSRIQNDTND